VLTVKVGRKSSPASGKKERENNHSEICPEYSVLLNKSLLSRKIILPEPN
jgi:hypothetical protein